MLGRAGRALGAVLAMAACAMDQATTQERRGTFDERRARMVDDQIRGRGVKDPRVLAAMARVPRHRFVPDSQVESAYEDTPLPIGEGQTISQPYIVAYMTEALALAPTARVLEIGTGSGYQAAILAELVSEVYTIEIVPALAARAARTLKELGYTRVQTREGDGYLGWPERAPFDAIIVTAAPDHVPQPLIDQVRVGGRLVIPVGRGSQDLLVYEKRADGLREITRLPVRFVPLTRKPAP
jgi:protein-L-isoaspartate(D-aspartate) O-methyltransferase